MRNPAFSLLSLAVAATLTGNALAQVPNEDCTGAIPVVQGANGPFSNVGSSTSSPWSCALGGNDVWYVYVSPGVGPLTVDTCGSGYDTALEVFDGNLGCGSLTSYACNDDSCGLQSSISVANVNPGDTIYIRVGGFNSATGTFTLNINGPLGPGQVVATTTNFGTGCVDRASASFYELFPMSGGPTFDLSNTAIMLVPSGNGYVVLPTAPTWYTPTGPSLGLGDDQVSTPQSLGFTLVYPGGFTNDVHVSSNGFVWAAPNTNSACCSGNPAGLISDGARWCALWTDLNPSSFGAGQVQFDQDPVAGAAYVTWSGVAEYGVVANLNTFQVAFFSSGIVEFRYQSCAITQTFHDVLTGFTPGFTLDPGSIDLSTALPHTTQPDSRALTLAASARPVIGNVVNLDTANITPAAYFGAATIGLNNPGIDLTSLGMAGCSQYTDLLVTLLFLPQGSPTASVPFMVPNVLGLHLYAQSFVYDPAAGLTLLGAVSSNGVDFLVGNL